MSSKWSKGTGGPAGDEHYNLVTATGPVTHCLKAEGFDGGEDGTGRGTPIVPVAMRESGPGYWMEDTVSGTLRAEGEDRPSRPSHVVAFHPTQDPISSTGATHALGTGSKGGCATVAVAMPTMQVRRLLPVECERLQGFPDGWTDIYRKKATPDGPRYKAMGNSMAVPVMRWIGTRLDVLVRGTL